MPVNEGPPPSERDRVSVQVGSAGPIPVRLYLDEEVDLTGAQALIRGRTLTVNSGALTIAQGPVDTRVPVPPGDYRLDAWVVRPPSSSPAVWFVVALGCLVPLEALLLGRNDWNFDGFSAAGMAAVSLLFVSFNAWRRGRAAAPNEPTLVVTLRRRSKLLR